ncbi:hypothetical protein DL95DRAFT_463570 [Leptodontidium sp. 2 PMI_412]|nr:hypothetical protein DL95DRAFT_463570 [Leptodontidium sp. 2 PMI_412]
MDLRNVAISLPQCIIGQIFAEFPESLEDAKKEQCDTFSNFVTLDWNCQDLERASQRYWPALLDPEATDWQALWILLGFVLRSLKKTHIEVILSGFDDVAYSCLRIGLEYIQNAKIYESCGPVLNRTKWLVIERPYKDTPGSFQNKSIVLHLKQEMEERLDSLHFAEYQARRERVENSANGTNLWLWDHPVCETWRGQDAGLLWIYDKPGSGKSTLAKALIKAHNSQKDSYLVVDFFYGARGGALETGHILMLQSILTLKFLLVLDGFDESDATVDVDCGHRKTTELERQKVLKLVYTLSSMTGGAVFKVIALSRPASDIREILKGSCSIHIKDENEYDISKIVQLGLSTLWKHMEEDEEEKPSVKPFSERDLGFDLDSDDETIVENSTEGPLILETPKLDFARDYVLRNANGVILWVVMILRELIKIAKSGVFTAAKLQAMVSTIPTSVQELYEDILRRIKARGPEDRRESQYVASWLLFAGRALRVDEFRDAFAMFHWNKGCSTHNFLDNNRVRSMVKTWAPVRSLLENLGGGLVEIVPAQAGSAKTSWQKQKVQPHDQIQLIHQTAKDFLLSNPDPLLFEVSHADGLCSISTACVNYLTMTFPLNRRSFYPSATVLPEGVVETLQLIALLTDAKCELDGKEYLEFVRGYSTTFVIRKDSQVLYGGSFRLSMSKKFCLNKLIRKLGLRIHGQTSPRPKITLNLKKSLSQKQIRSQRNTKEEVWPQCQNHKERQ